MLVLSKIHDGKKHVIRRIMSEGHGGLGKLVRVEVKTAKRLP